jgi:tRNA U34 5-carboxymethylaminomethyl modifying GTPase MnmE/TrmE
LTGLPAKPHPSSSEHKDGVRRHLPPDTSSDDCVERALTAPAELASAIREAARALGFVEVGFVRTAFREALAAVERARAVPPSDSELVAAELQGALRALDGIAGGHSPEQLLDRIYGRFCLGK